MVKLSHTHRGILPLLHHVARIGDLEAIRMLLAAQADPHRVNLEGASPVLQMAADPRFAPPPCIIAHMFIFRW